MMKSVKATKRTLSAIRTADRIGRDLTVPGKSYLPINKKNSAAAAGDTYNGFFKCSIVKIEDVFSIKITDGISQINHIVVRSPAQVIIIDVEEDSDRVILGIINNEGIFSMVDMRKDEFEYTESIFKFIICSYQVEDEKVSLQQQQHGQAVGFTLAECLA